MEATLSLARGLSLSAVAYTELLWILAEYADLRAELMRYRWQLARDAYLWN